MYYISTSPTYRPALHIQQYIKAGTTVCVMTKVMMMMLTMMMMLMMMTMIMMM